MKNLQSYLVAALLCATPAFASDPVSTTNDDVLDILVVTPSRMQQELDQAIASTSVISRQDIVDTQAADVPTLLRMLAGVEITQGGGMGKQSSIFMRGTNSAHVLVLLDGVRINSATTGVTALEHIMLDSIERIEVVRGNVSSLYGSEAMGGVIQLFTRRGHGVPAFNISAGMGSQGMQRLAAGLSGGVDATSFNINVGRVKTDGVSAINTQIAPTANPDRDGYDNTTVSAHVRHALNADHQLSASIFGARGDSAYDNSGNVTDLHNTLAKIDKISLASDDQLTDDWHSHLAWARGVDESRNFKNGAQTSYIRTINNQLVWQNEVQLGEERRVNLAVEQLDQAVDSTTLYTRKGRSVSSLLGGYVAGYGTQQVQVNLRQDRYTDFGVANTGLLGYGVSFADNWRATASLGSAFKAPTFNDMYGPSSWGSNPNLRPERSFDREIGLHYAAQGQRAGLQYFDNRIRDLIEYPAPSYTAVNINQAHIDGVELSYDGEFGDTSVKANLTLQDPRNAQTGQTLLRRAKSYGNVGAEQRIGAWRAGGEIQFSGPRIDYYYNTSTRTNLGGYGVMNLSARYTFDKRTQFALRVDNVFGKEYMLLHGYNTPGRALFAGVSYHP